VTGVSLILQIAFVAFVFSGRVTPLPATCTGKRINCLCSEQLCWGEAIVVHLFEVMSKHITHSGMIDYPPLGVCLSLLVFLNFE